MVVGSIVFNVQAFIDEEGKIELIDFCLINFRPGSWYVRSKKTVEDIRKNFQIENIALDSGEDYENDQDELLD